MLPLRSTAWAHRDDGRRSPRRGRLAFSSAGLGTHGCRLLLDTGVLSVGTVEVPLGGFRFDHPAEARHCVLLFPRGLLWVHEPEGGAWPADATTLVRHRPGRSYASVGHDAVRFDFFGVAPEALRDLGSAAGLDAAPRPLEWRLCGARGYALQRLAFLAVGRSDAGTALDVEESTLRALGRVLHLSPPPPRRPHRDRSEGGGRDLAGRTGLVGRTRLAVAQRCAEHPSIDEIAAAVGISPFHLCRTFKRGVGLTLHQYVNDLRLRAALEQVAMPDADLSAIALDLGFSSHSHFTARFRDAFGETPSAFRRRAAFRNPLAGHDPPGLACDRP